MKTEASQEALSAQQKTRRKRIEQMVATAMTILDPSKENTKRWHEFFAKLSDTGFVEFIDHLKNKRMAMNIVMPNMVKPLQIPNILEAAKEVGLKTSHRLWMFDQTSGRKYLTNEKYLVVTLPIRRAQQFVDKKMSVSGRSSHIDALTGQVVADDKACALSAPEIQSLNVRGLEKTMNELVRVRGGDVHAFGDFNRQLQENGEGNLDSLDPSTRARSATIAKVLLQSMMIDNNF